VQTQASIKPSAARTVEGGGPYLLAVVAAGLIAFGFCSLSDSGYRRIQPS
jgi:hypothetical protein